MEPARGRGGENLDERRGTNTDAAEAAVPSGHDGARQALSDLRRMIDPEWDRIRRELIGLRQKAGRLHHHRHHANRLCEGGRNHLMADALATIGISRAIGSVLRLLVLRVLAAGAHQFIDVTRDEHERDDDAEEGGAKEAHERES